MSRPGRTGLAVGMLAGIGLVGGTLYQTGRLDRFWNEGWQARPQAPAGGVLSATAARPARPRVVAEGRVVAYPGAEVVVGSELGGRIVRLEVREKDRVEAGQVLAVLNGAEIEAARAEAVAQLAEAEADTRFYQREVAREEALIGRNAGTRQNVDAQRRSLELAQAHRDLAQAAIDRLDAQLDKTVIRAPISGVVISRQVDQGETIGVGTPIATVADLAQLRIEAEVDEYDTSRVRLNAPVTLNAEGHDGRWQAQVEEIPDSVVARAMRPGDPGRPIDARVLLVKIRFTSEHPFKLGQRVEVEIAADPLNATDPGQSQGAGIGPVALARPIAAH